MAENILMLMMQQILDQNREIIEEIRSVRADTGRIFQEREGRLCQSLDAELTATTLETPKSFENINVETENANEVNSVPEVSEGRYSETLQVESVSAKLCKPDGHDNLNKTTGIEITLIHSENEIIENRDSEIFGETYQIQREACERCQNVAEQDIQISTQIQDEGLSDRWSTGNPVAGPEDELLYRKDYSLSSGLSKQQNFVQVATQDKSLYNPLRKRFHPYTVHHLCRTYVRTFLEPAFVLISSERLEERISPLRHICAQTNADLDSRNQVFRDTGWGIGPNRFKGQYRGHVPHRSKDGRLNVVGPGHADNWNLNSTKFKLARFSIQSHRLSIKLIAVTKIFRNLLEARSETVETDSEQEEMNINMRGADPYINLINPNPYYARS